MKLMKKQLVDLLNIYATSGNETPVREYLQSTLSDSMDKLVVDNYGNLLGEKKIGTGKGAVILLSAHMDTVRGVKEDKKLVQNGDIITAELPDGSKGVLGADDRAGIAIILAVLRNIPKSFNGTIKLAFSREEEIGCIGANQIDKSFYRDVDLAIVVDRKGNKDIVVGCDMPFCSSLVGDFMEDVSKLADLEFKCVEGGISDAMVFSSKGINSINLSAGYRNEHTIREWVSINDMRDTVKLILQALAVVDHSFMMFGDVPNQNKWIKGYMNRNQYREYYFGDVAEELFEIVEDEDGDIYVYGNDDDITIQQGDSEITMSLESLEEILKKVNKSLAKRV